MLHYQTSPVEPGKWYITKQPSIARKMPGYFSEDTGYGAGKARLAGPYDDEQAAESALAELLKEHPEYRNQTYLWHARRDVSTGE